MSFVPVSPTKPLTRGSTAPGGQSSNSLLWGGGGVGWGGWGSLQPKRVSWVGWDPPTWLVIAWSHISRALVPLPQEPRSRRCLLVRNKAGPSCQASRGSSLLVQLTRAPRKGLSEVSVASAQWDMAPGWLYCVTWEPV